MRFELTTTDLEGRGTTSCTTEMSKMIPNLPTFHWRRSLPVVQLVAPRPSRSVVVSSNLIHATIYMRRL